MARGDREFAGVVDLATPNVTIPILSHSLPPGVQQMIISNSGDIYPKFVANMLIASRMTLVTQQMTALSSFGIGGAAIATADMWFQQKVENGGRNATSKKLTMLQGMGVPMSVTAALLQNAELTLQLVAKSADGTTDPVTAGTGTMASNPAVEVHTIGPIKLNGTEYDADSLSVDFGLQVVADVSGGQLYPTSTYLLAGAPSITATFKDVDARIAIGTIGLAQDATDSTFFLRKLAALGGRIANNVAEHIKFTMDDGMFIITEIAAAHGEESAKYQVTATPLDDGTAAIIVIDTASIIT